LEDFSATDSEEERELEADDSLSEGEDSEAYDDDDHAEDLGESYISRESIDNAGDMANSMMESVSEDQAEASDIEDQEDQLQDDRQSMQDIELRVLKSSGSVISNMLDEQLDGSESHHARQPAASRLVLR
jgi:phosphatidate phosphatase LPIN